MLSIKITCFLLITTYCDVTSTFVEAFLPRSPATKPAVVLIPPTTCLHGRNTLGHGDFSTIFGPQEAAERQMRDLASEYRPPSKKKNSGEDDEKDKTKDGSGIDSSQDDSVTSAKRTLDVDATKTTTIDATKSDGGLVDEE